MNAKINLAYAATKSMLRDDVDASCKENMFIVTEFLANVYKNIENEPEIYKKFMEVLDKHEDLGYKKFYERRIRLEHSKDLNYKENYEGEGSTIEMEYKDILEDAIEESKDKVTWQAIEEQYAYFELDQEKEQEENKREQ